MTEFKFPEKEAGEIAGFTKIRRTSQPPYRGENEI